MARLREDNLRTNLIINGDQAKKELGELEVATRDLKVVNKELRVEKKKLETANKKESEEYKKVTATIKKNNAEITQNEAKMKGLRKQIGLTGLTTRQLGQEQKRLRSIMANLTPGTAEWKKYRAELKKVDKQLGKVSMGSRRSQSAMSKLAGGFNKFALLAGTVIASLTGIVFGLKELVMGNASLTDSFADVRKTTGLTDAEIKKLYKTFKGFNTRTANRELLGLARIAGKLGVKGKANIEGFVKSADKLNVALGEDLGGNVEDTIKHIGKLVDIFKVKQKFGLEEGLLKVGSAINALGASSTASEQYIVEFSKRVGGIAPNAKMSAADVFGLAATLDQLGQTSEVSSTVFGKLMVAIGKDVSRFAEIAGMELTDFSKLLNDDVNAALIKVLEGAQGSKEGLEGMAESLQKLGIDGQRSVGVIGVLTKNIALLKKQQKLSNIEFDKGTSLTEEFNIKNETLAAKMEKVTKRIRGAFINSNLVQVLNNVVGAIEKWTRIPLTETLEKEQAQVNLLVMELQDVNIEGNRRLKILEELKNINPDIVAGIDAQNINYQKLNNNLKIYNENMISTIILAKKDEEIEELRNEAAERRIALLSRQRWADQILLETKKRLLFMTDNDAKKTEYLRGVIEDETKSRKEKIKILKEEIPLYGKAEFEMKKVTTALNRLELAEKRYKDTLDETNAAVNAKKELYTELLTPQQKAADVLDDLKKKFQEQKEGTDEYNESLQNLKNQFDDTYGIEGRHQFNEFFKDYLAGLEKVADAGDRDGDGDGDLDKTITAAQAKFYKLKKEIEAWQDTEDDAYFADATVKWGEFQEQLDEIARKLYKEGLERKKELGILSREEEFKLEMIHLQEKDAWKLVKEEEQQAAMQLIKDKYKEIELSAIKEFLEQYNYEIEAGAKFANSLLSSGANFFQAAENKKLNALQDRLDRGEISQEQYEQEKLSINKEYAKKQQDIDVSQALIAGAMGVLQIIKGEGTGNVIADAIIKGLLIAAVVVTTASEIDLIKSQQFAKGKYDVIGADDGRRYSARNVGKVKTGYYSEPSVGLFSENEPEIVIDGPTTRNIMNFDPGIMDAINYWRAPQYATGKNTELISETTVEKTFTDPVLTNAIIRLNDILEAGIIAKTDYLQFLDKEAEYNSIVADVS